LIQENVIFYISTTHALGQPVRQASASKHERWHASPQIVNSISTILNYCMVSI